MERGGMSWSCLDGWGVRIVHSILYGDQGNNHGGCGGIMKMGCGECEGYIGTVGRARRGKGGCQGGVRSKRGPVQLFDLKGDFPGRSGIRSVPARNAGLQACVERVRRKHPHNRAAQLPRIPHQTALPI